MALHMDIGQNVPQDEMYEKFQIDRPGKITFIGHHLSAKDTMRCLVRAISLYGAELDVSADLEMPVNFYLEILGIRDEIGCTLIRREEEKVTIGFNMLIDAEFAAKHSWNTRARLASGFFAPIVSRVFKHRSRNFCQCPLFHASRRLPLRFPPQFPSSARRPDKGPAA